MTTRYAQISETLARDIAQGLYPIGSVLPTELDLAKQFGVSRSTIRAAMHELQTLGLVSRKKSAGTRVEADRPISDGGNFLKSFGSINDIRQFGEETEREILITTSVVADDEIAAKIGARPGSRWLHLQSVRRSLTAGNRPICWSDIYISDKYSERILARIETHSGILSTLIEELSGRPVTEIRQDISAKSLSKEQAEVLESEPGDLSLAIRRQYILSPSDLAEVSISLHPVDRFNYHTRLTRQSNK